MGYVKKISYLGIVVNTRVFKGYTLGAAKLLAPEGYRIPTYNEMCFVVNLSMELDEKRSKFKDPGYNSTFYWTSDIKDFGNRKNPILLCLNRKYKIEQVIDIEDSENDVIYVRDL